MPEQIQVNNIESIRDRLWYISCKNMDYLNKNVYKNKVICDLTEDIKVGKVKSIYDKVLDENEYKAYLLRKGIM